MTADTDTEIETNRPRDRILGVYDMQAERLRIVDVENERAWITASATVGLEAMR